MRGKTTWAKRRKRSDLGKREAEREAMEKREPCVEKEGRLMARDVGRMNLPHGVDQEV